MADGRGLWIGDTVGKGRSKPLVLPPDCGTHTFAAVGQRGSGKSSLGMVMAAEMCDAGIPWAAVDRVGNWRGLKFKKNGKAAYRVVCVGGKNEDIPFEPMQGALVAEAVARSGVNVVIDCYGVDLPTQQIFVRDFCRALERIEPALSTHIFFEETAEYGPQSPDSREAKQCLNAVASLFLLGRNWGYGATALLQRPADVNKRILSQCETLFMLRTSGSHDLKALKSWQGAHGDDEEIEKTMKELSTLKDGEGFVWSPMYLGMVAKFQSRERETFHPGETRKGNGGDVKKFDDVDVSAVVSKLRKEMSKTSVAVPDTEPMSRVMRRQGKRHVEKGEGLMKNNWVEKRSEDLDVIAKLKDENSTLSRKLRAIEGILADVRKSLKPQFDVMKRVFSDTEELVSGGTAAADSGAYADWLPLARKRGCGKMLEVLIQFPELTKDQLGIKAGISPKKSTWRGYMAWLKKSNLIEVSGDVIRLKGA